MPGGSRPDAVFVIGAGVSSDLGYPLTRDLLFGLMPRLDKKVRRGLERVIRFHHPGWSRAELLPEIEEFLTELAANEDLLDDLRPNGPFGVCRLRRLREDLLLSIGCWFHDIYAHKSPGQSRMAASLFRKLGECDQPVAISFNWDCELDSQMLGHGEPAPRKVKEVYGLTSDFGPLTLLKPHGSLNWFDDVARHIKPDLRRVLWHGSDHEKPVHCFLRWRLPTTTHDHRYVPWLVPPTHMKDFDHKMLRHIWRRCVDALSTARRVYFLGYSLPVADWHARYIIRCGFWNQVEGLPTPDGGRADPTGRAQVIVVNPDNVAFRRIEGIVGYECAWVPKRIERWLEDGATPS